MFRQQFFKSTAWHNTLKAADAKWKNRIVEVECTDGERLTIYRMKAWRTCLVMEVYIEETIALRFIPYDFIRSIVIKEKPEDLKPEPKRSIGFVVPEEELEDN